MMPRTPRDPGSIPPPLAAPSPSRPRGPSPFWALALLPLLGAAALIHAGCSDENPCAEPGSCPMLSCIPSAAEQPVGDDCGVFVSPSLGVDAAVGSKAKPFKSIKAALAVATSRRIYLCAEEVVEAVTLRPGFSVYGGLNCSSQWELTPGAQTVLTALPGEIPLTVAGEVIEEPNTVPLDPNKLPDGGDGTPPEQEPLLLEDIQIVAKDAEAPGGSSIAIFAYDAYVSFNRSRVEAGDAGDGVPGESEAEQAASGLEGNAGNAACSAETVLGGDEVPNRCGDIASVGGTGGLGSTSGGSGATGLPDLGANGGVGDSGAGCTPGLDGAAGAAGADGEGALGPGLIARNAAGGKAGYRGTSGKNGAPGSPGQGGGGGGGSKAEVAADKCVDMATAGGASGGSGGAGGCGGLGGKAGGPGGSSIAIISLNTKLEFANSIVVAKKGGKGGDGGAGQKGGGGGVGGVGGEVPAGAVLLPGCAGGSGGVGGDGGRGGGGQGGHSIGIAFISQAPPGSGVSIQVGMPGAGGAGGPKGGSGAPGKSPNSLRFQE